jgi:hypothetical protein
MYLNHLVPLATIIQEISPEDIPLPLKRVPLKKPDGNILQDILAVVLQPEAWGAFHCAIKKRPEKDSLAMKAHRSF